MGCQRTLYCAEHWVAEAPARAQPVWAVGALCRALADALQARFGTVCVRGELSGFTRAASGHCYFSIKDAGGQLRCALFQRAAAGLTFAPRDGELVEVTARVGVYEPRGELQLVVQGMRRAGQGSLYEEFLRLKVRLESLGLFDPERKRALPLLPRGIGLVTSLGAAALHDVLTTLRRRAPHVPVVLVPASVQGAGAATELVQALETLYAWVERGRSHPTPVTDQRQGVALPIDAIVLVRGGGAMEDLWAFNDEVLAHTLARSPVPLVCGVGHETDFTIADFVADVRAPTPTAAAELVAQPREAWLDVLQTMQQRWQDATQRLLERQGQRLDLAAMRLGRPTRRLASQQMRLATCAERLRAGARSGIAQQHLRLERVGQRLQAAAQRGLAVQAQRLAHATLRLELLDPHLVLERGYAWLTDAGGAAIGRADQLAVGQDVRATLVDGTVDLRVLHTRQR